MDNREIILIFALLASVAECFPPFQLPLYNILGSTHPKITKDALLTVASNLLKDNPNPRSPGSAARIDALGSGLSFNTLLNAYYNSDSAGRAIENLNAAVQSIVDSNNGVDFSEKTGRLASYHFDSEKFTASQDKLNSYRWLAAKAIQQENYDAARQYTGILLHTLQDFYSHSNWVEMGMTIPYEDLAQYSVKEIPNVASPDKTTCKECSVCSDAILPEINKYKVLTSGYYRTWKSGWQKDDQGRDIEKLAKNQKCSHGGILDLSTTIYPKGDGINKDSVFSAAGMDRHFAAANLATTASAKILTNIRTEVGDDVKFGKFLNLDLGPANLTVSICYVIDTTGSMGDELPQIQASIGDIRSGLLELKRSLPPGTELEYILVPFNDPDPGYTNRTFNVDQFLSYIGKLSASGGGDCPEPSIGALIRGLKASQPRSSVYVFTDAPASDENLASEAARLITEKNIKVTYALTQGCSRKRRSSMSKRQTGLNLYSYLASLSGGQVLNVGSADISKLSSLVFQSVQGNPVTLFYRKGTDITAKYQFFIDSTIYSATVTVTGTDLTGIKLEPPLDASLLNVTFAVASSSATTYVAIIGTTNVTKTAYGTWTISLGSSGSYTIQVTGLTGIDYTYSIFYTDDTQPLPGGLVPIEGYALQGSRIAIFVQPFDQSTNTTLNALNILSDSTGMENDTLTLTYIEDGMYYATTTILANSFRIQVTGQDNLGNNVSRIGPVLFTSKVELLLETSALPIFFSRPGETKNLVLSINNNASLATNFSISVISSGNSTFKLSYPATIYVAAYGKQYFNVTAMSLLATEGLSEIVTVRAAVYLAPDQSNTLKLPLVFAANTSLFRNDTVEVFYTGTYELNSDTYTQAYITVGSVLGTLTLLIALTVCLAGIAIHRKKAASTKRESGSVVYSNGRGS